MSIVLKPISLTGLFKDSSRWFTINSTPQARWDSQAANVRGTLPTLGQPSAVFIDMVIPAQNFSIRNLPTNLSLTEQAVEFTFSLNSRTYVIVTGLTRCEYDAGPPADFKVQIWGQAYLATPPFL